MPLLFNDVGENIPFAAVLVNLKRSVSGCHHGYRIQGVPGRNAIALEDHSIGHYEQNSVYVLMYICRVSNGFQDRAA
jgi:hypothetical protein